MPTPLFIALMALVGVGIFGGAGAMLHLLFIFVMCWMGLAAFCAWRER